MIIKRDWIVSLIILVAINIFALNGFSAEVGKADLKKAGITMERIFKFYDAGRNNLLNETYPARSDNKVTYLAGEDTVTVNRVAYLWPTSGLFSGVVALLKTTGSKQYLNILEKRIIPGLQQYYDTLREPACYQSYITATGKSDRYYDDNVWLALDFCELFSLTGKREYLDRSVSVWKFVISGWDEKLGGGIYWCEQKKQSKNTCSNAPASVLALKLFEATRDSSFYEWGLRIYDWTKENLQDRTDNLYFDNRNLSGRTDTRKYTYNSGQMLQASAILFRLTGNKTYLEEAQNIAKSAINHFTEEFVTPGGKTIRLFRNTGNWFNAVMLRGYEELFRIDGNSQYVTIYRDNMDHLWENIRDKNGLFSKDWKGTREESNKSLLDQAALVEIWAVLAGL